MKKILWLASWYPSKVDPYTGDFIERHARAASLFSQIKLLHVAKDKAHIFPQKIFEEKRKYEEGGEASVIYYHSPSFGLSWLERLYSIFQYLKIHENYFNNYVKENGKPDGIHVHIALNSGLFALFLKFRYRITYVVSEHWSGLCPEAKPNFDERPFFTRLLWKWVMKNAAGYSAVSEYLSTAMADRFLVKKGTVIPNVVDSKMFYPSGKSVNSIRFIHISLIKNYQKNLISILDAAAIVISHLPKFKLIIFGQPNLTEQNYVSSLQLGHAVEFRDMSPQAVLREYLQESVALILYSRFETFGCVIIEANACGVPAIVSDIPVLHENVRNGLTGAFVPLDNPSLLAEAMIAVALGKYQFDPEQIKDWALSRYSFEKIGNQFAVFYDEYFN